MTRTPRGAAQAPHADHLSRPAAFGVLFLAALGACSGAQRPPEPHANRDAAADGFIDDAGAQTTAPGLKVAFLGDQGVNANARGVLQLVVAERADALIHLGDLSYGDASPETWEAQLDDELGADFPVVAVIGNHDVTDWYGDSGFEARLRKRLTRTPELHCDGEYGVDATCTFRGLSAVLLGVGSHGDGHEPYLESALTESQAAFRLCIWHKNQHDMQVGAKADEIGWAPYQLCASHGAPILTGHEHSYSRTLTLTAVGDRAREHGAIGHPTDVELAPGSTFVVVSGLGGQSRRAETRDHESDSWWAAIYAQGKQLRDGVTVGTEADIQDGALFIDFHVDGDPYKAHAYFKTVNGELQDEFTWRTQKPRK